MTEIERVHPERPPQPRPLTPDEIEGLLDLVIGYTRREPDKTLVEIWATQSLLGRWTFAEAARAIHTWGGNRGKNDFLEPSDVTRAIRAERQDRALRAETARARDPGRPASPETRAEAMRRIRAALQRNRPEEKSA